MGLSVTGLYAGLLGVLYIYLNFSIVLIRLNKKISLGDGGNKLLAKRIRVRHQCLAAQ